MGGGLPPYKRLQTSADQPLYISDDMESLFPSPSRSGLPSGRMQSTIARRAPKKLQLGQHVFGGGSVTMRTHNVRCARKMAPRKAPDFLPVSNKNAPVTPWRPAG